jgi:ketosteroid isomerase-like protein
MSLETIANALVDHCKSNTEREALETLYAQDALSVEAMSFDGRPRETAGVAGIQGKHDWWEANMEVSGGDVVGPFLHAPDRFAVIFRVEGKEEASGETFQMEEVALYTVADDKIVREEFFNTPYPMD